MYRSLEAVQRILDILIIVAPISGQLSTTELNPGQSISMGKHIGQVDIWNKKTGNTDDVDITGLS